MSTSDAARGLLDDTALLEVAGARLILTSDTIVESVHYRADDPPESIGWKLAAVNLSDLASKGARPLACLMNYALSGDADWDARFLAGLHRALDRFGMPLVGGDTVAFPAGAPRALSLTAIGSVEADAPVPGRDGARPGDMLCIGGPVGDAGAGLALLMAGQPGPAALITAYREPQPQLALGRRIAAHAHAMMDVSDGLLIDAARMAEASGLRIEIEAIPLSGALMALRGGLVASRLKAATAGDDYVLLGAFDPSGPVPDGMMRIGRCLPGKGLALALDGAPVPLPAQLGWVHGEEGR